jgi:hypothetical protein
MGKLRRWMNEHAPLIALVVLVAVTVSGWVIYRYGAATQQTDLANTCCPVTSKYGPEGKIGSLLMEAGLKTLALDAVRRHFPKNELVFQNIKVLDAKKGLVEVTVSVKGKHKRLKVDLTVPNGKITELPTKTAVKGLSP